MVKDFIISTALQLTIRSSPHLYSLEPPQTHDHVFPMLLRHLLEDVLEAAVGVGLHEADGQVSGEDATAADILGVVWKEKLSVSFINIKFKCKKNAHLLA